MLNYIATENTAKLIEKICKNQNILILYKTENTINISEYLKETKVNFNLIKHFIIELSCLDNTEEEIIQNIYNFNRLHTKTRIIILASGYNDQNIILTNLYDLGFYNIINESESELVESKLNTALSENGIQKTEAKKFKKREVVIQKDSKLKNLINKVSSKSEIKEAERIKLESKDDMPTYSVYLFSLLLEAITRLVKFICYVLVFGLTSVGLTIMLNRELREIVFQIFGLK